MSLPVITPAVTTAAKSSTLTATKAVNTASEAVKTAGVKAGNWFRSFPEGSLLAAGGLTWAGIAASQDASLIRDRYERQTGEDGFVPGLESWVGSWGRRTLGILTGGALGYGLAEVINGATKLSGRAGMLTRLPLSFIGAFIGHKMVQHHWPSTGMKLSAHLNHRVFGGGHGDHGDSSHGDTVSTGGHGRGGRNIDYLDPYGPYYGYRTGFVDANNDGYNDIGSDRAPLTLRDMQEIKAERAHDRRRVNGIWISPHKNPPVRPDHPNAPPYDLEIESHSGSHGSDNAHATGAHGDSHSTSGSHGLGDTAHSEITKAEASLSEGLTGDDIMHAYEKDPDKLIKTLEKKAASVGWPQLHDSEPSGGHGGGH